MARYLFILIMCQMQLATANVDLSGLPIVEIEIQGNERTQARFVLKWAQLAVGDLFSQQKIDRARQNILNTDLFKQVTITTKQNQSRLILVIELEEKIYTLLLPRITRNADNDIRLGINLKLYNIAGANQSLNLLAEKNKLSNGQTGQRYRLSYELPQYDRPYRYRVSVTNSVANTTTDGLDNTRYDDLMLFSVIRDWHLTRLPLPISITTSVIYQRARLLKADPSQLVPGEYNRFGLNLGYNAVDNLIYRRSGYSYSIGVEQGSDLIGSDFPSSTMRLDSRFYQPLNNIDNLNSRLVFGLANNSPFDSSSFQLGSSNTFRGLKRGSITGDALLFGNVEYVKGFENSPSVRVSSFIDIGNVYRNFNHIDITNVQTSVGLGVRWKALLFVKTDLVIDYAYNLDAKKAKIYAGTSLAF